MDRNQSESDGVLNTNANGRTSRQIPRSPYHARKSSAASPIKESGVAFDTDGSARSIPRPTTYKSPRKSENPPASPSPTKRVDRSASIFDTPRDSRTRIPRPRTTTPATATRQQEIPKTQNLPLDDASDSSSPMRQPMDLNAAFRRAKEQDAAADGANASDSTLDLSFAFDMANAEFKKAISESPSSAPRPVRRELKSPISYSRVAKVNDIGEHLQRFDRNHQLKSNAGLLDGLLLKSNAVARPSETGRTQTTKTTGNSLHESLDNQNVDVQATSARQKSSVDRNRDLARRLSVVNAYLGDKEANDPVPSMAPERGNDNRTSPDSLPAGLSADEDWNPDADFTAEDLELSASPRISMDKSGFDPVSEVGTPAALRRNERLSNIHKREVEVAKSSLPGDGPIAKHMSSRLNGVRVREMEASSRRALALSRLEEIRMNNSQRRSKSPEKDTDAFKEPLEEAPPTATSRSRIVPKPSLDTEPRAESIRDTATRVKSSSSRLFGGIEPGGTQEDGTQENEERRGVSSRSDSHGSLRDLARTTSSNPEKSRKTEEIKETSSTGRDDVKQAFETHVRSRSSLSLRERGTRNADSRNAKDRPTVGFADLVRKPSSDSIGKQSSVGTSNPDPTDRIDSELDLFAPSDNYSERGSMRAPSPVPSEPVDEDTPRAPKIDPLMQPTPRVSGAYVDTPATVRVEKDVGLALSAPALSTQPRDPSASPPKRSAVTSRTKLLRRAGPRSASAPTTSRSRSSSRRRRPLINTAKPPTVREDILTILRANDIDDSTLENLDVIEGEKLQQILNDAVLKVEENSDVKILDGERELDVYDRMNKTLQTGLLGIRSAKKGIEELEDKVTHKAGKGDQPQSKADPSEKVASKPPSKTAEETGPVLVSLPRLYRRQPRFRLTWLGVFSILFLIWYALESAFTFLYAGPEYICTPAVPCDWSPNEPYFPYTMPFMLDEWATGGRGRELALEMGEQIGDMAAEITDWITNTDFTQADVLYMDAWQRMRHRRRLRKHGLLPKWTQPPGYKPSWWEAEKTGQDPFEALGWGSENESEE